MNSCFHGNRKNTDAEIGENTDAEIFNDNPWRNSFVTHCFFFGISTRVTSGCFRNRLQETEHFGAILRLATNECAPCLKRPMFRIPNTRSCETSTDTYLSMHCTTDDFRIIKLPSTIKPLRDLI